MLLIHKIFTGDKVERQNYKAPKGLAYFVESMHVMLLSYDEAAVLRCTEINLIDYEVSGYADLGGRAGIAGYKFIGSANSTIMPTNTLALIPNINHTSKYLGLLSSCCSSSNPIAVVAFVYGKLVPMSQVDEIWEFITKATI